MKGNTGFSWDLYKTMPIVGIIRGQSMQRVRWIAEICQQEGFNTLEVTLNTENAGQIIAAIRTEFPDMNVGAGTVCNMDDLNLALEAGAQFIVTPIIDEKVISTTVERGIPIFPGAYTPSEIYRAWQLGASAVKVFPASQLGTQYIKEVLAPLDQVKLLPTGGVSIQNIRSFFQVGAFGVGMGSALFNKEMVNTGDTEAFQEHLQKFKQEVNR